MEEEAIEYIPTVLDDVDDTKATPTVEVNCVPSSLPATVDGNQPNHVESYHAGNISLSKQPQNTDIDMNKCGHSSDDKQLPSTLQLLLQPDSSQVNNPSNGQNNAKPSCVSSVVEGVSCTRGRRGEFLSEGRNNEASLAEVGKTIVPLALSTAKDNNLQSSAKEATQEVPSTDTRLVLQRIVEVNDFIAKDPSLNAMSFTPTDIERAATFLLHLPDVSCFYVAATRLLSKAGWRKEHQLQDDDLQSFVLKEIAKGWTLATGRKRSKFTRFHLALVLGAYSSLNPLRIDSISDAIINIVDHMIPSYHNVFCAEVYHSCPVCSSLTSGSLLSSKVPLKTMMVSMQKCYLVFFCSVSQPEKVFLEMMRAVFQVIALKLYRKLLSSRSICNFTGAICLTSQIILSFWMLTPL